MYAIIHWKCEILRCVYEMCPDFPELTMDSESDSGEESQVIKESVNSM